MTGSTAAYDRYAEISPLFFFSFFLVVHQPIRSPFSFPLPSPAMLFFAVGHHLAHE